MSAAQLHEVKTPPGAPHDRTACRSDSAAGGGCRRRHCLGDRLGVTMSMRVERGGAASSGRDLLQGFGRAPPPPPPPRLPPSSPRQGPPRAAPGPGPRPRPLTAWQAPALSLRCPPSTQRNVHLRPITSLPPTRPSSAVPGPRPLPRRRPCRGGKELRHGRRPRRHALP